MPAEQNSDEDDVSSSNDERTNVNNLEVDTAGIRQRRITTGSGISVNTGGGELKSGWLSTIDCFV